MPPFTISDSTYYRLLEALGYTAFGYTPIMPAFATLQELEATEAAILKTLDELDEVYAQLVNMLPDSLAVELDGLKVNYAQQRAFLYSHGERLTARLSSLSHLPPRQPYFKAIKISAHK